MLLMPHICLAPLVPLKSMASTILYTFYAFCMLDGYPPWTNWPGGTQTLSRRSPRSPVDKASRSTLRYILRLVMAVEYWKIEISRRRDNLIAL
jgi:hypothetical protein